ncbi:RING finger protein unkempt homolog isoform X7 [Nylanderia fulva]|uniref:RING finger protein unkempt homolog isoform X7 n=1 Tax=Nylanderia fulva TaxID=613905 RepID=UPI0010FB8855|nr:RING finger protein unkempt homolog isoform X7 [Nylanderia fulva]
MKSDSKPLLTAQAEKANHYTYLKEFRVEQCPLFIQRKCTQHRPFTCFNWHFMNQRRRRPVRKRDRTFNYSADNYCTKYDETTGICPDGDESTPCPNVKHGEEWGEPGNCEQGDACTYCHTRTEQQFHPEIYKSTKCNDVQQAGYCPRGVFCAFAHVDRECTLINLLPTEEMSLARDMAVPIDCGANLADILSNALPPDKRSHDKDKPLSDSSNGSGEVSESGSISSLGSNSSHSKAPGAQLHNSNNNNSGINTAAQQKLSILYNPSSLIQVSEIRKQMIAIDSDPLLSKADKAQQKQGLYIAYNLNGTLGSHSLATTVSPLSNSFYSNDTVESVVGNALDELHLDDPLNLVDSIHTRDTNSPIGNSISAGLASSGLLGSSAPVNIPGMTERSVLTNFSPSTSSPLQQLQTGFLTGSRFSHQDSIESTLPFMNQISDPFSNHISQLSSSASKLSGFNSSLFDFASQGMSPSRTQPTLPASPLVNAFSISPSNTGSLSEVQRLRDELSSSRAQLATWDERINQARAACAAWQLESEEAKRKANIAEQQRDEALMQMKALRVENETSNGGPYLHSVRRISELRSLSIATLKSIQSQLRSDLEEVEKVLYRETATKCMVCEEQNRTVTLSPCNHYVVCSTCAPNQRECPYCQTPVVSTS